MTSLMDRVQRVQGRSRSYVAHAGQEPDDLVEAMRIYLHSRMPSYRMAQLIAEHPQQARNEIRSICFQGFAEGVYGSLEAGQPAVEHAVADLLDSVFGLGPLEALLADESITEIMVNGHDSLFYERDGVIFKADSCFKDDEAVRAIIDKIIGPVGRRIDESSPMVDARLPQGYRVNAVIPPLSLVGPVLTIRKFSKHVITLEEMADSGSIDEGMLQILSWAIANECNMAVSGGTGTGKTTLLNALSCKISGGQRIVTIEDSAELRFFSHPHVVRLEARPRNAEGLGQVTIRDLVINALRMRPDRIIVGECRGDEANDMLVAMNTGHLGSLTTLHANSPQDAVIRLSTMVRLGADLPQEVIEREIGSALDLIVQIERSPEGKRYVSYLVQVLLEDDQRKLLLEPVYVRELFSDEGAWLRPPVFLKGLVRKGAATSEEVVKWESLHCLPAEGL